MCFALLRTRKGEFCARCLRIPRALRALQAQPILATRAKLGTNYAIFAPKPRALCHLCTVQLALCVLRAWQTPTFLGFVGTRKNGSLACLLRTQARYDGKLRAKEPLANSAWLRNLLASSALHCFAHPLPRTGCAKQRTGIRKHANSCEATLACLRNCVLAELLRTQARNPLQVPIFTQKSFCFLRVKARV